MCQFNFCLHSNSFLENGNTLETIYSNIEHLSELKDKIDHFHENILRHDDIHNIIFYDGKEIYKILYSEDIINNDYKKMLGFIIDRANEYEDQDISQYIGLNHIENEDLIYTIEDWYKFHYNDMKSLSDELKFSECIKKYFPNLTFNKKINNALKTLDGGLFLFSTDIIKSLIYLEKELKPLIENSQNLPEALSKFTSSLGLETTLEGNSNRKEDFTFTFLKNDGTEIQICCEPHIKLDKSSVAGDTKWYSNRIYFYQGRAEVDNGNILIGHIGKHL